MVCVSIPCSDVCILKPQMIIRPKLMLFSIVSLKTSVQMTSCKQFQGDIYVFVKYISYYTSLYQVLHLILDSSIKTTKKNITSQIRINKSTTIRRHQQKGCCSITSLENKSLSLQWKTFINVLSWIKTCCQQNKFCIRNMTRFLQRTSQLWIKLVQTTLCSFNQWLLFCSSL